MTLRRRLDRLEARHGGKSVTTTDMSVLRPVVTPGAAGPVNRGGI
ncbi:hypothetical protein [Rhodobaculum claviforme]|nr:hypothetical protein [Rhodobaculum claviforme]